MLPEIQATRTLRQVGEIISMIVNGNLNLTPPYQRGSVWNIDHKRNLWKSLLMGLPVGAIFTNLRSRCDPVSHLIDGQQRCRALVDYYKGVFGLPREWLADEWVEKDSRHVPYQDLTLLGQRKMRLGIGAIAWYETQLQTEAEEAQLYLLINFGGVEQSKKDRARAERIAGV